MVCGIYYTFLHCYFMNRNGLHCRCASPSLYTTPNSTKIDLLANVPTCATVIDCSDSQIHSGLFAGSIHHADTFQCFPQNAALFSFSWVRIPTKARKLVRALVATFFAASGTCCNRTTTTLCISILIEQILLLRYAACVYIGR